MAIFTGELDAAAIAAAILEAPIWLIVGAVTALVAALTAADAKWKIFGGNIAGFFSGIGSKAIDFFSGVSKSIVLPGVAGGPGVQGQNTATPLLPQGSQSTQNVHQQTSIVVNGAADANAVGKHVVNQQDRVNFDMTRNMKGAVQ